MKQRFLLLALCFCLLGWNAARAGETEPNNTWNQANTLALNGSNSGIINPAGDIDWWKVKTNGDGQLSVTLSALSGKNTYVELYDTLGVVKFAGNYTTGTLTISADGLATGTYYIKVYCYFAADTSSYLISNTLTKPTQANDAEPDSTRSTALTLPLGGSTTGHIGYYFNNHRDSLDEYKVTTNTDGALNLTLTSANGQNVYFDLYDNNGTTLLHGGSYTTGTYTYTVDGLAAGTYYIKVHTYYTYEFAPYTLSNTLTVPSVPNDAEPDSTRGTALTLPLGGTKTGHIGYYYNNHRDSLDEYKVTTNTDGALNLTLTSADGQNVYFDLYDNDGTTLLHGGTYTTGTVSYTVDGLAAGTYYIKVHTYYTYEFAPYTLSNTLTVPAQANDAEPDSTKATALVLPLNGSVTGHIGYYYNNHRDTTDEYKVTTNADGNIQLTLTAVNGTNVWFNLYDNDGNTLLTQNYTSGTLSYNTDGLSAGTYYIKVFCYYNGQFAPYILKDTLYTYNANDKEPNKYASQAMTLPANDTSTGHVGFYYKNVRDTVDWYKINYTGTGALSVSLGVLANYTTGGNNVWMQIYKDTSAAPIYNAYTTTTETANFTGLAEGYYYVKLYEYYSSQFSTYTITPTWNQVDKAKITLVSADSTANCDSTGSITFKCKKSHSPYSVQLYDFNKKYGNAITTNGNAVFSNLAAGSYYAIVYGDGATGTAHSKSVTVTITLPTPTGTSTTNIKSTQAKLNWVPVSCATVDSIRYRVHGTTPWTYLTTTGNTGFYTLKGLTALTAYDWEIAAVDSSNGSSVAGAYTDSLVFTTTATLAGGSEEGRALFSGNSNSSNTGIAVYPNPASSELHIRLGNTDFKNEGKVLLALKDMSGRIVWSTENTNASQTITVDVSRFTGGLYMLQTIHADGSVSVQKVVITK